MPTHQSKHHHRRSKHHHHRSHHHQHRTAPSPDESSHKAHGRTMRGRPVSGYQRDRQGREREVEGYLSPNMVERIFEEQVKPHYKGRRQNLPIALCIIGQPGAGKTTVAKELQKKLGIPDAVYFDGDDFPAYHPRFKEFALRDDLTTESRCSGMADKLNKLAYEYVLGQRTDFIVQFQATNGIVPDIQELKERGYQVKVAFLAVDNLQSTQGIIARYLEGRARDGHGRWCPLDSHDRRYARLPALARDIDTRSDADAVYVVRRGGEILAATERGPDGRWQKTPNTANVLRAEQTREWTEEEQRTVIGRQARIEGLLARDRTWLRNLPDQVAVVGEAVNRKVRAMSSRTTSPQVPERRRREAPHYSVREAAGMRMALTPTPTPPPRQSAPTYVAVPVRQPAPTYVAVPVRQPYGQGHGRLARH